MSAEEDGGFESELAMVEGIFCAVFSAGGDNVMRILHKYCTEIARSHGIPCGEVTFHQIVNHVADIMEQEQLQ
jgi:hypothetical protein